MSINWNGTVVFEKHEWIDVNGIVWECGKIKATARDLKNAARKSKNVAQDLDSRKVLAVNNETYASGLYTISKELEDEYEALDKVLDQIKTEAKTKYNEERSLYSRYTTWKAQQEAAARKAAAAAAATTPTTSN